MTGPHADKPILVHWHAMPHDWPITSRQVMVGPYYDTVETPDGFRSINVPQGQYDLKPVVDRLPRHQRPAAIIVVVDSTKSSFPRNLAAIDAAKALVMGDTHHLEAPLRSMVGYALSENFDLLVGNHLPQHLHFFREARRGRLAWIPGVWVRQYEGEGVENRDIPFVFVGQVGAYHPYRQHIVAAATAAGLPLELHRGMLDQAALAYGRARLTLNCSLNGDLNQRIFEVIGSGGALITDELAPEANLESVVMPGRDCITYDGAADLVARAAELLAQPARTTAMARAARATFRRLHRPVDKARQLLAALFGGDDIELLAWRDRRLALPAETDAMRLRARLLLYEFVQEIHRAATAPISVAIGRGVDRRAAADLIDLPRLRLVRFSDQGADPAGAALAEHGLLERFHPMMGASVRLAIASPR
ncbi:MAG: glycosyltransferase family 1 protein, partial [Alphaproteobacteria bacterium]|nr:glycosyltransferase family 1 protein [Alphaproteobacteria bacterium]